MICCVWLIVSTLQQSLYCIAQHNIETCQSTSELADINEELKLLSVSERRILYDYVVEVSFVFVFAIAIAVIIPACSGSGNKPASLHEVGSGIISR